MHVLHNPILHHTTGISLLLGPSISLIHFLHKFFTLLTLKMTWPHQSISFHHSTTPLFTQFVQFPTPHLSCTLLLFSPFHLVMPHAPLRFPQHALLTVVSYSMFRSNPYVSVDRRILFFNSFFM